MINGYTPHAAASGTAGEVRELKQRRRRAGASTAASSTAAKIAGYGTAGQRCHAHCHAPFRPRLPVWLPSSDVSSTIHGRNCAYWNSGRRPLPRPIQAAATMLSSSSTAAKIAGPETAGERPLPRPIQAAATSLAAEQ